MIFGYARVSTATQAREGTSLESQEAKLKEAGADRLFIEKGVSGAKASRPELDKLTDQVRDGDVVIVTRLDRMGRDLEHLIGLTSQFRKQGVTFRSLTEGIDSSTTAGRMMIGMLGAVAEFERERILERTSIGREAARKAGKLGGRPRKWDAAKIKKAQQFHANPDISPKEAADALGVSRATYYRLVSMDPTAEPAGAQA